MYVDPGGKPFAHLGRLAKWADKWPDGKNPAPVTIEWDLSNRCVLGCQDCHFAYTHTRGPWAVKDRMLPMAHDPGGDIADTVLVKTALWHANAAGVQSVVWTGGGEPTTHPDWPEIIDHAYMLGFAQGMYTLGGLLSPDTGRHLAERATWVVVSLDAANPTRYAQEKRVPEARFYAALDGIKSLVGYKATIGVSFLLHEDNWRFAPHMVDLARTLGATYTTLRPTIRTSPASPATPVGDRNWVTDALPLLHELLKEPDVEVDPDRFVEYRDWTSHGYSTCYGIRLNTTITPDGRMWVCPNRREYADSCLGDLRTEQFDQIWARHPGQWTDFKDCRAMCRLHLVNRTLAQVYQPRKHAEFI